VSQLTIMPEPARTAAPQTAADGMSLDDKRIELLPPEKLGPVPRVALSPDEHAKNNLPDILARWRTLYGVPALAGQMHPSTMRTKIFNALQQTTAPPAKAGTPYH
jgi:hypothetical protein